MDGETLQQTTTHKGRENSKLQDLQMQEGSGESIWNISDKIQGTTRHNVSKAKGCLRDCFDMCGVVQHAEDTPGGSRQGTHPSR